MGTVWGILPYFTRKSEDAWGHQSGPVIYLPEKADVALTEHEKFHVKQWYAVFIPSVLLVALTIVIMLGLLGISMFYAAVPLLATLLLNIVTRLGFFRTRKEQAAYGESIRVQERIASKPVNTDALAEVYALILNTANPYSYEKSSKEEHKAAILGFYRSGKLF